jgi:hypothetical protein
MRARHLAAAAGIGLPAAFSAFVLAVAARGHFASREWILHARRPPPWRRRARHDRPAARVRARLQPLRRRPARRRPLDPRRRPRGRQRPARPPHPGRRLSALPGWHRPRPRRRPRRRGVRPPRRGGAGMAPRATAEQPTCPARRRAAARRAGRRPRPGVRAARGAAVAVVPAHAAATAAPRPAPADLGGSVTGRAAGGGPVTVARRRPRRDAQACWRAATRRGRRADRPVAGRPRRGAPGYGEGPDPETSPLTLTAWNRAGFITIASQPGTERKLGWDGTRWRQRAAVQGLAAHGRARSARVDATMTIY